MRSSVYQLCRVLAILILVSASAGNGFGQDCRVTTTVRVLVEHEQPLLNITTDQLRARIGGSPAKVVAFSPGNKPHIILLIDISSSMKPVWAQSLVIAKELAGRAGDLVAAVVFNERIVARANGGVDTNKLLDQLSTLKPSQDGTALYDTLIDVAGAVKERDSALVVISDGQDNSSRHSAEQTVSMFLRSSWPPVFGIVLDYDEQPRRKLFNKIVAATGGLIVVPPYAAKVAEAQKELAAQVYAPFTVTLQPVKPLSKGAELELDVLGPNNKPRHDIHIIHAAEVTACDAQPSSSGPAE